MTADEAMVADFTDSGDTANYPGSPNGDTFQFSVSGSSLDLFLDHPTNGTSKPDGFRYRHHLARKANGLAAAQVSLGHSETKVTEVYAERDLTLASKVVAEIEVEPWGLRNIKGPLLSMGANLVLCFPRF